MSHALRQLMHGKTAPGNPEALDAVCIHPNIAFVFRVTGYTKAYLQDTKLHAADIYRTEKADIDSCASRHSALKSTPLTGGSGLGSRELFLPRPKLHGSICCHKSKKPCPCYTDVN